MKIGRLRQDPIVYESWRQLLRRDSWRLVAAASPDTRTQSGVNPVRASAGISSHFRDQEDSQCTCHLEKSKGL